jgi:hypothetical protein
MRASASAVPLRRDQPESFATDIPSPSGLADDLERTLKPHAYVSFLKLKTPQIRCFILKIPLTIGARSTERTREKAMLRFIIALIYGEQIRPW